MGLQISKPEVFESQSPIETAPPCHFSGRRVDKSSFGVTASYCDSTNGNDTASSGKSTYQATPSSSYKASQSSSGAATQSSSGAVIPSSSGAATPSSSDDEAFKYERTVPSLPVIRTCNVCYKLKYAEHLITVPCNHDYCMDCTEAGFVAAVANRQIPFKCCGVEITLDIFRDTFRGRDREDLINQYELLKTESEDAGPLYCNNVSCNNAYVPKTEHGDGNRQCKNCGKSICTTCEQTSHEGLCDFTKTESYRVKEEQEKADMQGWATCPRCDKLIKEHGGRTHVPCPSCKTLVCYICERHVGTCNHHQNHLLNKYDPTKTQEIFRQQRLQKRRCSYQPQRITDLEDHELKQEFCELGKHGTRRLNFHRVDGTERCRECLLVLGKFTVNCNWCDKGPYCLDCVEELFD